MPRSVRNFWMDATIDGRNSDIGTGPRSKDGGMDIDIYIRDDGSVAKALSIRCVNRGAENVIYVDGQEYKRTVR